MSTEIITYIQFLILFFPLTILSIAIIIMLLLIFAAIIRFLKILVIPQDEIERQIEEEERELRRNCSYLDWKDGTDFHKKAVEIVQARIHYEKNKAVKKETYSSSYRESPKEKIHGKRSMHVKTTSKMKTEEPERPQGWYDYKIKK